ncbi:MAG: polysaccharide lyase, partial [Cyanobacteria bacterium J06631_2]
EDLSVIGEADSNYPTIKLGEDQINDVRMIVSLNTPGKANGEVEIYLNNRLLSHAKKLMFRESADEKFSGLAFDIFHGGGSDARIPVNASILLYEITVAPH